MVEKSLVSRHEAKIRELEIKLEFEKTQVKRLEVRDKDSWRSACSASRGRRASGSTAGGGGQIVLPERLTREINDWIK